MSACVAFVGPSLPALHHAAPPGVIVHPPAAQGDIARAVAQGYRTILLVDGVFGAEPAVWHKEILWALDRSVRVLGAASMGALRAAELHRFGMIGVGTVFAAYRDGLLEADDEVALLHGPADTEWLALSEPLVNIRASLARAVRDGALDEAEARATAEAMRALFYPERTRARLEAALALVTGDPARTATLMARLRRRWVDAKRADAARAWRRLLRPADDEVRPSFTFCPTAPWLRLWRTITPAYSREHTDMTLAQPSTPALVAANDDAAKLWALLALVSGDNNLAGEIVPDATELYGSPALSRIELLAAVDAPDGVMRGDFRLVHHPDRSATFDLTPKPARNFGARAELAALLTRGLTELSARQRALFVWGHGEGWRVSIDDGARDHLEIPELIGALGDAGIGPDRMLDLVVFDACLMGTVENMADLAPFARYALAAGEVVPSTGLPYRRVIDTLGAEPVAERAATAILDAFVADGRARGEHLARMVAVRLDRAGALVALLDEVGARLEQLLSTAAPAMRAARLLARGCRAGDQVDAEDLLHLLARHTGDATLTRLHEAFTAACSAAIVHTGAVESGAGCGLNVWFPTQSAYYRRLEPKFLARAASRRTGGGWMRFLASWHASRFVHGHL